MNVTIIGAGYVGLTTGAALAYLGHQVSCVDVDRSKIDQLKAGKAPFFEPGLNLLLEQSADRLTFSVNLEANAVENADVIFIAVGTPSNPDGSPNMIYVEQAVQGIGTRLGDHFVVVVNKSTVPIGSGNWVGSLIREAFSAQVGHKGAATYAIASNPEFLREGSAIHDTFYPDRIVIGSEDPRAVDLLSNLYRPLLNQDFPAPEYAPRPDGFSVVPLVTCDLASAELIKYAANAFLATKISYANEIAQLADCVGADIKQVMRGIGLDERIGPRFLQAGVGWGGSCFAKDTAALVDTASDYGLEMAIVQAARQVNYRQRRWVVEKLLGELKILKGRTVGLLGLAFKPNTDDLRDAPSLDIGRYLIEHGVRVNAHDPVALHGAAADPAAAGFRLSPHVDEVVEGCDALVLVTEWPEYRALDWEAIRRRVAGPVILDGRNFLDRPQLEKLGFHYIGIGLGRREAIGAGHPA